MANKNAYLNYEQKFYIDETLMSGVTNIDGSFNLNEDPVNILGKGYTYSVRQGSLVGNFNISKYVVGEEVFLNYTGDNPINGSINYGNKSFGFEDAYLQEYSISAGIGQIPTANVSLVVYGDIGSGISSEGDKPHPDVQIPNQGSIKLTFDGNTSNRVTDFSYTLRINRRPVYVIGSPFPIHIHREMPIVQEANLNMEVYDYELIRLQEYFKSPQKKDLTIEFNNPITESLIHSFTIENASINSQSIRSSVDDVLSISVSYLGYINER